MRTGEEIFSEILKIKSRRKEERGERNVIRDVNKDIVRNIEMIKSGDEIWPWDAKKVKNPFFKQPNEKNSP